MSKCARHTANFALNSSTAAQNIGKSRIVKRVAATETQAIEKVHNAALSAFYQRKVGGPNTLIAMSNGK